MANRYVQLCKYVLRPINTRTGNYSAKYLFYRYDAVVAMILPVTGFHLECEKINRVESDNYPILKYQPVKMSISRI